MFAIRLPWALGLVVLLGGCAATPQSPAIQSPPPFYVPATAMRTGGHHATGDTNGITPLQLAINPEQVLPGSDADSLFAPRGEKVVYGALSYGGLSAFTIYTYDVQNISSPFGSGFRYRWLVQSGVTVP